MLVLYDPHFTGNAAHSYWASNTFGDPNAFLLVSSDIPYVSIMKGSEAVFPVPARVKRTLVTLDDGSKVTVDNISSQIPADIVAKIVLTADRSTKTGCPLSTSAKGLFAAGDRIAVSDYYVAWFDYTLRDGVEPPPKWPGPDAYPRSGTLAGLWSLDPQAPGPTGAYFAHVAGIADPANRICANWPRNELIVGSNSPEGQWYWWDKYSPGLENTMDITQSSDGAATGFFSSVYAQAAAASNFQVTADGVQDSSGDLHYATSSLLTSDRGATTFRSALTGHTGHTGSIKTTFQYIPGERGVAVVWDFSSTAPAGVNNVYASLWLSYTGQYPTTNYTRGPNYPLPTNTFGNLHRYGLSNLGVALSGPVEYAGPLAFSWEVKGNTPIALPGVPRHTAGDRRCCSAMAEIMVREAKRSGSGRPEKTSRRVRRALFQSRRARRGGRRSEGARARTHHDRHRRQDRMFVRMCPTCRSRRGSASTSIIGSPTACARKASTSGKAPTPSWVTPNLGACRSSPTN
jgi:hypothetical protein